MGRSDTHYLFEGGMKNLTVTVATHLANDRYFIVEIMAVAQQVYGFIDPVMVKQRGKIVVQIVVDYKREFGLIGANSFRQILHGKTGISI